MSQKPNHDAKNIGARFRSARSLVPNLNRKSFCERYEINRYTMQSWENGLHVSKGKNVEKFIEALSREGVFCTSEWLIDGAGDPARPLKSPPAPEQNESSAKENNPCEKFQHLIGRLQEAHRALDDALVSFTLSDDAMAPKYLAGDTVLGISSKSSNPNRLHQKQCIVELSPERKVVRQVLVTKENLLLTALDERVPTITVNLNIPVYEIVWHLLRQ